MHNQLADSGGRGSEPGCHDMVAYFAEAVKLAVTIPRPRDNGATRCHAPKCSDVCHIRWTRNIAVGASGSSRGGDESELTQLSPNEDVRADLVDASGKPLIGVPRDQVRGLARLPEIEEAW